MVITLSPELEAALKDMARRQGIDPEVLALNTLRERFLSPILAVAPRRDLEQILHEVARDCGVSLPNSALTSDELYD